MRACPVCGGTKRFAFLERDRVPVFQNAPAPTVGMARAMPVGRLQLVLCETCSLIANAAFSNELVAYGADYENDQSYSPVFQSHLDALVDALVRAGVSGRRVLEAGCGNGSFLVRLCRAGGNTGVGYDPAYRGPASLSSGSIRFVDDYYRGQPEAPEVVISRHVIEHVADPLEFLRSLRGAMRAPARIFLETPAAEWILDRVVVQDVFYEHCCYFSAASLRFATQLAGFQVERITRLFGGQYLWLEAQALDGLVMPESPPAGSLVASARRFAAEAQRRVGRLEVQMREMRAPVALWGAGAKGVTLVNLLDPAREWIAGIVDVNPKKQGRFVPGSGHPILAPDAIAERGIRSIVVMNPNYAGEISASAKALVPDIAVQVCDEF